MLSDSAADFFSTYGTKLDKPLRIGFISKDQPQWGRYSNNTNEHLIGINQRVPDYAFDAVFCHELFHAYQSSTGFPTVIHEVGGDDMRIFLENLRSNILDLSADDAVRAYGLNDSFVMNYRFKQNKQLVSTNFQDIRTKYAKDLLSIDLILDMHSLTEEKKQDFLCSLELVLPDVFTQYSEFQVIVVHHGYNTPKGCFNIMGCIVDKFKFWPYCSIEYCGKNIRSFQRFNEYCERIPVS